MSRFIRRNLKKITSQGRKVRDVSDGRVPGLSLVVQKTGVQSWTLRYRFGEHQRRYTIGRAENVSAVQARKIAQGILTKVAAGVDPMAQRAAERSGEVKDGFVDQAIRFVETYSIPQNKSWPAQARMLGLSLNWAARRNPNLERHWAVIPGSPADRWGKRTVQSITKRDIVEVVDAATERGPIIANRVHATLSRFFSWTVEKALTEASPAQGTKAPSTERSRDRVLTVEELSAIWFAAEELKPPFDAFVRLLILTAARRNEVGGMRESELSADGWLLPAARSKTAEPNLLPLPPEALEIIKALPRSPSGLLLTTTGKTPISGFSKMKRQLDAAVAKRRKIASWTLHDVRRSVATGMASLGVEPHVVDLILGHRFGKITRTYNLGQYANEKKAALQRWADRISLENLM
jgi:integrase